MIIFVLNTKITGYFPSADLTDERKQEILSENPYAVWVDEELNYPDDTKQYEMHYIDGSIEYREIYQPKTEPTAEEMLNAMLGVTSYE
jgi:hypothetical protein